MTESALFEIAIPVYNEERRLETGVRRLHAYCEKNGIRARIVIADNGSQDQTVAIAKRLIQELRNVYLIQLPQKGVGRALKCSWENSQADFVGYMDVDLSTDLKHLKEVRECFDRTGCDIVNGSRLIRGARVFDRKLIREITSRGYNFVLRTFLQVGFTDGMCGFKFMRQEAFRTLLQTGIQNEEWFFNTEILIKAEWAGLHIEEIPVIWRDDHDSKAQVLEMTFKFLREIWRLMRMKATA